MQLRILRHACVDSTNERAFAALAEGSARHGDVHLAREQRAGRGRQGRTWHSPAGEGLYASLVLLPGPPPLSPAALTMAGGLAMLDAARELFGRAGVPDPGLQLDWPNDLCVRGAKLAGVLVETRGLDAARPHYVVGLGLDVRQRRFPEELLRERAVTSLALLGLELELGQAESALLEALPRRFGDLRGAGDGLAREFLAAIGLEGRRVGVRAGGTRHEGECVGLELERGVGLRTRAGEVRWITLEFVQELAPV